MKWHILVASLVLATFVIGSSLPVDSTALGARDTNVVQSLKVDVDATKTVGPLTGLSFDKAVKSGSNELLAAKKVKKRPKAGRSSKTRKTLQITKVVAVPATPSTARKLSKIVTFRGGG
jgi:hypothetical protein